MNIFFSTDFLYVLNPYIEFSTAKIRGLDIVLVHVPEKNKSTSLFYLFVYTTRKTNYCYLF